MIDLVSVPFDVRNAWHVRGNVQAKSFQARGREITEKSSPTAISLNHEKLAVRYFGAKFPASRRATFPVDSIARAGCSWLQQDRLHSQRNRAVDRVGCSRQIQIFRIPLRGVVRAGRAHSVAASLRGIPND